MPAHAVENPIINSPYEEPQKHWKIHEHDPPEELSGRRKPSYIYLPPGTKTHVESGQEAGNTEELKLVSLIRERLAEWRPLALRGEGGVTRITMDLLNHWRREGRQHRLFFAQLEAAETVIFLTEARADLLQGIDIPLDQPDQELKNKGADFAGFHRRCCKMATGAGKTTVMAMLAAWSILNKRAQKSDKRFSDAVLVVCPNVTIRDRLAELDPQRGDASLYRTRDLVPAVLMPQLREGRVRTVNWHIFEPRNSQSEAKVVKTGRRVIVHEIIYIGDKTTTARGRRYMTEEHLHKQLKLDLLQVHEEIRDKKSGVLKRVKIESERYIESNAAVVRRVLGPELATHKKILVFNDEAHHAYRLRGAGDDTHGDEALSGDEESVESELIGDHELAENYYREATVWVEGLDKIHKKQVINFCVDFSATPYFLGKAGKDTNRIFPWTVSDFGLQDAIEAGLVKIPQLAVRDSSGASVPGYFNIWQWILPQLTKTERGGKKSGAKPEAILKYAHTPIAMLGSMWEQLRQSWENSDDPRPPVFILVCKTKKLARVVHEWLADAVSPNSTIPNAHLSALRNSEEKNNTICVYSDLQQEIESGNSKSDENRWMRHTLDTIGKIDWPRDRQGRPHYPEGFEELAAKMEREKYPPGRDVRCIVSVGMLTEGWDCSTVTHIIGLRPFMSQLLCEQVIGRGLRRASYEVGEDGLMHEEVATVLGVPLSAFTVKLTKEEKRASAERYHIYAIPAKARYKIQFPRVESYRQIIRRRMICRMEDIPSLPINPTKIPPQVDVKAALSANTGRPSLHGPGKISEVNLEGFRRKMRLQQRIYEMTAALTREYAADKNCELPVNLLFTQLYQIVRTYIAEKVSVSPPADIKDAFLSPYYDWIIENLRENIRPDESADEAPELPVYERLRGSGSSAEVDFFTRRKPYAVQKSHINAVVPDTQRFEQLAAYHLDKNPQVFSFVKNEGMGFGIPYLYKGEPHEYMPDFLIRLQEQKPYHLILETKLYPDEKKEAKISAAKRWVAAVNADAKHGHWWYRCISDIKEIAPLINTLTKEIQE